MDSPQHAVYGTPPVALTNVPAGAVQCSPLILASADIANFAVDSLDEITVLAPPGTLERRYILAGLLRCLKSDGRFTVLAPKDKGGSRVAKELAEFGCAVTENSKQHFRICRGTRPATLLHIEKALEEGGVQRHAAHGLWTQPGVFSWDRIDVGSALLLQHLPKLKGTGADLGCGIGVLSRNVLASAAVTSLSMVDIDRRAVACAERNSNDPRTRFLWADATDSSIAPASQLDFVVMNPPFHSGGEEDKALGQRFIHQAARLLKPRGVCWLTANRHLPYEKLLESSFSRVQQVADQNGFKIIKAEK